MDTSNFSLDKVNQRQIEQERLAKEWSAPYLYVEPTGYTSLWEYWRVVVTHRVKLLGFAVAGLLAAVIVSLLQAPVYRDGGPGILAA